MIFWRRGAVAVPLVLLLSTAARADEKEVCASASEQGARLRAQNALRAARAELLKCTRASCPVAVAKDCEQAFAEVDAALPTIVVGARDAQGKDLSSVRVAFDGAPLLDKLDGSAVAVDPGEHTFRFTTEGAPPVEQTIIVRVGEKNRAIAVTFAAPPAPVPPPVPPPATPPDNTPILVGAIGLGVLAVGLTVGAVGLSEYVHMKHTCAPACSADDAHSIRTKLWIADVAAVVGLATIGFATWMKLGATPVPGGAVVTGSARF